MKIIIFKTKIDFKSYQKIIFYFKRRLGHKHADELQKTILELESKHKNDLARLKKKYEGEHNEFILQIDSLNHANGELNRANKGLSSRIKVIFFKKFFHEY